MSVKILIPLPSNDFDPTEAAVSWKILHSYGHDIYFATPDGMQAAADPIMISGIGLDPWGCIPGLRNITLLGRFLRAYKPARAAYAEMQNSTKFRKPLRYCDIDPDLYDALLLPGGHAPGMRPYLEDQTLRNIVRHFFSTGLPSGKHKPVAAVCHGVVLAARTTGSDGRSVLWGKKTTALPWKFERNAWNLTRFFGRFWDPDYYRTYTEEAGEPVGYWSVEEEVRRALESPSDFINAPDNQFRQSSGLFRDTPGDPRPAWTVQDGNYLSARWPGDVHTFARAFHGMIQATYGEIHGPLELVTEPNPSFLRTG